MNVILVLVVALAVPETSLPLKSVTLYENGVAQFTRAGRMGAGAASVIPLEPGQLDDALKSLVVVSEDGVASVEYAPPLAKSAAHSAAGMPELGQEQSLVNLLQAFRGTEVMATSTAGSTARGRVVGVSEEAGAPDKEGKPLTELTLLLFGEQGLSRLPVRLLHAVRPVEAAVSAAWARAVSSSALKTMGERLLVRAAKGGGNVEVAYTTEAPVWRTTYRLLLGGAPRVQGFALVHNDSDEVWDGVKVTLASGRPTSFVFPLAGPRYARRELVATEDGLENGPQLSTGEAREHLRGEGEDSGLGVRGSGSRGEAFGLGGIGTVGRGGGAGGYGSSMTTYTPALTLEGGPTPLAPAAVSEAGDLFLYSVREPVRLGARKSALLPIVDGAIDAESYTVINSLGAVTSAVRVVNSTALTLEGGTLAVFEGGTYVGESRIDRLKPKEVRVAHHGEDLDLQALLSTRVVSGPTQTAKVTGEPGHRQLEVAWVNRVTHALTVSSKATTSRKLLLELHGDRYRLISGADEDARSPGQPRYAKLSVAAHADEAFELVEDGVVAERMMLASLTSRRLSELLERSTKPELRALLSGLLRNVGRAEALEAATRKQAAQASTIESNVTRLRASLEAAGKGGATKSAERMAAQVLQSERELVRLQGEVETGGQVASELRQRD
jgi:hypothetical protein